MSRIYFEFLILTRDIIKEVINDYINYKKAQITLWKYHRKDNFCTACGIINGHELEALVTVSEYENIQKNKKDRISRIKNSKKTAL